MISKPRNIIFLAQNAIKYLEYENRNIYIRLNIYIKHRTGDTNMVKKEGVEIPFKVKITSFIKNHKILINSIIDRFFDVCYWFGIYAILSFILGHSYHLFFVSISAYFLYKELITDIIGIKKVKQ